MFNITVYAWRAFACNPCRDRYLSHLLDAVGEDVSDDDPLLRRGPQVHLDQDNVVEQHQVADVRHLRKKSTTAEGNQRVYVFACFPCISKLYINKIQVSLCSSGGSCEKAQIKRLLSE